MPPFRIFGNLHNPGVGHVHSPRTTNITVNGVANFFIGARDNFISAFRNPFQQGVGPLAFMRPLFNPFMSMMPPFMQNMFGGGNSGVIPPGALGPPGAIDAMMARNMGLQMGGMPFGGMPMGGMPVGDPMAPPAAGGLPGVPIQPTQLTALFRGGTATGAITAAPLRELRNVINAALGADANLAAIRDLLPAGAINVQAALNNANFQTFLTALANDNAAGGFQERLNAALENIMPGDANGPARAAASAYILAAMRNPAALPEGTRIAIFRPILEGIRSALPPA